ncbi:unnamed protein product [Rotaria sp. Silwood1]|nr:unnamed protein product [Rotaria sp. Silwood1]
MSLINTASHYLPNLLRDGLSKDTGIQRVTNNEAIFDFLKTEENTNIAHNCNETMTSMSSYHSQYIVNSVDFDRFNTIVDIGGGLGCLLAHILEKYSPIKQGICFDLPNVIQEKGTETELEKRNISKDRYPFIAEDMFDPKTIPQADAYIMKSVIHD